MKWKGGKGCTGQWSNGLSVIGGQCHPQTNPRNISLRKLVTTCDIVPSQSAHRPSIVL